MANPTGRFVRPLFILLCACLLGTGSFVTRALTPGDLLIDSVQITGGSGVTDNDFVRIYNASSEAIDLNGLRLVKRSKSGTTDTSLKSWTSLLLLQPGLIYTWANSTNGFATSINADASSTQTLSADNGIAIRLGTEDTGTIIDSVGWGTAANGFVEDSPFPSNPGANEYIKRINYQDSNNNASDFQLIVPLSGPVCGDGIMQGEENCDDENTVSGDGCSANCRLELNGIVCGDGVMQGDENCDDENTISGDGCSSSCLLEAPVLTCGNGIIQGSEECDDGNFTNGDGCSAICTTEISTQAGEIYINEFIVDPVSGSQEWIELYSPSTTAFSLENWSLEDGSGTKSKLSGSIGGANHYYALNKSMGALNNSGDIIILRDAEATIKHSVTYGDWDDGNVYNNAPTASDPYSIARIRTATATGSDKENYAITSMLTMWAVNIITAPQSSTSDIDEDETDLIEYDYSKTITISEIAPNPVGIDSEHSNDEFIELYNSGDASVKLEGWRIEIGDKQYVYEFQKNDSIASHAYLVLKASKGFSLTNNGSTIKLFQPTRTTAFQTVTYKEATEGSSWILQETISSANKIWLWTVVATPGATNIIAKAPVATFSLSGEKTVGEALRFDSSDTETSGSSTTFLWNFGDAKTSVERNPEHAYNQPGSFTVSLKTTNRYGSSEFVKKITIADIKESVIEPTSDNGQVAHNLELKLRSILPNPSGADTDKESIEIINEGNKSVNLQGWRVSTSSKKGAVMDSSLTIGAGENLAIPSQYIPALNNSAGTVNLLAPDGTIMDTVSYDSAMEAGIYSYQNGDWEWVEDANEENDISIASLDDKNEQKLQSISGIVTALPGTFSTQYFFLKLDGKEEVLQIYNSKKLFPTLQLGQQLRVNGEYSTVTAGLRFKTDTAADITVIGTGELPTPTLATALELSKAPHPRLARVSGEVTSKKSPRLILTDASGDIEIYLAKGSGLSVTSYALGDKLTVSGITQLDGDKIRLMPRSEADISFSETVALPTSSISPETLQQKVNELPRDVKRNYLPYIIISIIGSAIGSAYLLWKYIFKK